MSGAGSMHVKIRNLYKILVGKLKETDHLEDQGVDGRIILEWILGKYGGRLWTGCMWLRTRT
jgi:hypothetical protein